MTSQQIGTLLRYAKEAYLSVEWKQPEKAVVIITFDVTEYDKILTAKTELDAKITDQITANLIISPVEDSDLFELTISSKYLDAPVIIYNIKIHDVAINELKNYDQNNIGLGFRMINVDDPTNITELETRFSYSFSFDNLSN